MQTWLDAYEPEEVYKAAVMRGLEQYKAGKGRPWNEVKQELGLDSKPTCRCSHSGESAGEGMECIRKVKA